MIIVISYVSSRTGLLLVILLCEVYVYTPLPHFLQDLPSVREGKLLRLLDYYLHVRLTVLRIRFHGKFLCMCNPLSLGWFSPCHTIHSLK